MIKTCNVMVEIRFFLFYAKLLMRARIRTKDYSATNRDNSSRYKRTSDEFTSVSEI